LILQALEIAGFFFGDEMGQKIKQNNWTILPEYVGVWRK
jgi:hypothetical protein